MQAARSTATEERQKLEDRFSYPGCGHGRCAIDQRDHHTVALGRRNYIAAGRRYDGVGSVFAQRIHHLALISAASLRRGRLLGLQIEELGSLGCGRVGAARSVWWSPRNRTDSCWIRY